MHYTYQCDQLTLLYLSVPLLVYFNKLQNSSEIANIIYVCISDIRPPRSFTKSALSQLWKELRSWNKLR